MKKPRHPNSLKNLKPAWEKGHPKLEGAGRPKGSRDRAGLVRKFLDASLRGKKLPYELKDAATLADILILALIEKAKTGDVAAYRELMDSAYGKIPEKQELTGADGKPLIPIIIDNIK